MRLYHFINARYGLASIRDQQFKISTYDELNDPFELFATTLTDRTIRHAFQRFKSDMAHTMGLLCCSKEWKSTLLWSHYADKHRGLALELEVDEKNVTHVQYARERLEIDQSTLDSLTHTEPGKGLGRYIMATKSEDWAYEKEARIQFLIAHLDRTKRPIFMPYDDKIQLVGVVIGSLSTVTPEQIENVLPEGKELTVRKARLAFGSFDVVTQRMFEPITLHGRPNQQPKPTP